MIETYPFDLVSFLFELPQNLCYLKVKHYTFSIAILYLILKQP
jgi:hypothetical protein